MSLAKLRNIGISAHIDSGKTTLSERILFYTGRIHEMGDVRDGVKGAHMDSMPLEKEKGITISSAATSVAWGDYAINLIDTPGHVDFTVEVERSLRVLDGAVLVLCASSGVQAQSLTIDRQMQRYGVPRVAFVNKMDRVGADPEKVMKQLRDKLHCEAVAMQLPLGAGRDFVGVVDLVEMQALEFHGVQGKDVARVEIPPERREEAHAARQEMLRALALHFDPLMELVLAEQEPPAELVHRAAREATLSRRLTPVFFGSAYHNQGVQPLLDAVCRYLPSPLDVALSGQATGDANATIDLEPNAERPTVAMAFKIQDDKFGALTYFRVYQGTIERGERYFNQRTGRQERFARIVRLHAATREDVERAGPGDIVGVLGVDAASGDTYCAEREYVTLSSLHVPEPVISMAISSPQRQGADKLAQALQRFRKEDPTFHVSIDAETSETIVSGMGELHLEIYAERIRREYEVDVALSAPRVTYRERPGRRAEFNYKLRKQGGGPGQYAHIVGYIEPLSPDAPETFVFENEVAGGRIPREFIPAVEKGFRQALTKGPLSGSPIVALRAVLQDGSIHEVDSSERAFQLAAELALKESFLKSQPQLLEPIMAIEVETPAQFQGAVVGDLSRRRAVILGTEPVGDGLTVEGEIPLAATFGYSTALRSLTQGQGEFSLEFKAYRPMVGVRPVEPHL